MNTIDLPKYLENLEKFLNEKVKKETPEESRKILIETGVIDENGKIILRHEENW